MASELTVMQEKALKALKGNGCKSLEALFDLVSDGRMDKQTFFQEHLKPLVKSGRVAGPQGAYWLAEELPASEKAPAEKAPAEKAPAEKLPADDQAAGEPSSSS